MGDKEDTNGSVAAIEECQSTPLNVIPADVNENEEEFETHDEDGVDELFNRIDPKYWNANKLLSPCSYFGKMFSSLIDT